MNSNNVYVQRFRTPVGILIIGSYDGKLCLCDWQQSKRLSLNAQRIQKFLSADFSFQSSETIRKFATQLEEYFQGTREEFTIPYLTIGSDFQKDVWKLVTQVAYGSTTTYSEIARRLHRPTAARAVANAIGSNALVLLIPCHRILGQGNSLTGYSGGIPCKQKLLNMESSTTSLFKEQYAPFHVSSIPIESEDHIASLPPRKA